MHFMSKLQELWDDNNKWGSHLKNYEEKRIIKEEISRVKRKEVAN